MSTATLRKVAADLNVYDLEQAYRTGRQYDGREQAIRSIYDNLEGVDKAVAQGDGVRTLDMLKRQRNTAMNRASAQKMMQSPVAKGMGYSPYAPKPLENRAVHPMDAYRAKTGIHNAIGYKPPVAPPVKTPSFNMRNMRNAGVGALLGGGIGYGMGGGWAGTAAGAAGGGLLAALLGKYLRDKGIAKWASMHKQASATISGNREVTTKDFTMSTFRHVAYKPTADDCILASVGLRKTAAGGKQVSDALKYLKGLLTKGGRAVVDEAKLFNAYKRDPLLHSGLIAGAAGGSIAGGALASGLWADALGKADQDINSLRYKLVDAQQESSQLKATLDAYKTATRSEPPDTPADDSNAALRTLGLIGGGGTIGGIIGNRVGKGGLMNTLIGGAAGAGTGTITDLIIRNYLAGLKDKSKQGTV